MTTPTPPAQPVSPWRWWVCLLLFLATTLNYMDRIALNQMAKRIKDALDLDAVRYSQLESGFAVTFATGAVLAGAIVDRVSVRWVYPVAVLGWSLAGFLTGYASGFWTLFACRVMLGLFEAANWPCGIRTTRAVLPAAERSFGNALFQSGTAIGAVVTPFLILYLLQQADPGERARNTLAAVAGGAAAVLGTPEVTWQLPFRAIGLLGVVWVVLWFLTIPGRRLTPPAEPAHTAGAVRFTDVFRSRRFWALLGMVIGINVASHTYRVWLPLYLQEQRGFTEADMASLTTAYYVSADLGSWTAGLAALVLIRRWGWGIHAARLLVFGACAAVALVALAVPFVPAGWALTATVLLFAFAMLGLFPIYFALSQDVSAKHQGKVSGILGASAHLFLAVAYQVEGRIVKATESYNLVLSVSGVFPLLAFVLMMWLWPPRPEPREPVAAA